MRGKVMILSIVAVLLLSSCSGTSIADGSKNLDSEAIHSSDTENGTTDSENQTVGTTVEPTLTPEPTATPTPTAAPEIPAETTAKEIASRKNPALPGEVITVTGTTWDDIPLAYTITVSNFLRGQDAYNLVMEWNQFNEIAEGEEVIIFDAVFSLIQYEDPEDEPYYVSIWDFEYFDSTFTGYSGSSIVVEGEYGGELYEGGTVSGKVALAIPADDSGSMKYDDFVWFKVP